MSQYGSNVPGSPGNGSTCDVANGSATVTLNGVDATSYIAAGDLFAAGDDVVSYEISAVALSGSDTDLTLVTPYGGSTATGASYVINTGFTANRGFARPDQGDVRGLLAVRRALIEIDAALAIATQSIAEAGSDNNDVMTALRVHQAFNRFGLGAVDSPVVANIDNASGGTIVQINDTVNGTLPSATTGVGGDDFGVVWTGQRASNRRQQLALTLTGNFFWRTETSGGWDDWQYALSDADLAANGGTVQTTESGTTANRPTSNLTTGRQYFDTTLGHPIWYDGSGWVDATGASV